MERIITVEDINFGVKVSAGTVRSYRCEFGRDLIVDMGTIEKELIEEKMLGKESAEIAENMIYLMAKEYDSNIPPMSEWLDKFSPYFVYQVSVHVITMWHENIKSINKSKKKTKEQ